MISKLYLILYNAVQTLGWSYLLYQMITHFTGGGSVASLYSSTSTTLNIFQTGALLEILHAGAGLVRSSVQVTFQQVWSRYDKQKYHHFIQKCHVILHQLLLKILFIYLILTIYFINHL